MSESEKPEDPLREELAKKAKAAGVYVHYTWDAARIEQAIAEAAVPSTTDGVDAEALQSELETTKTQLAAALAELEGVKTELATASTAVTSQQEELLRLNQELADAKANQVSAVPVDPELAEAGRPIAQADPAEVLAYQNEIVTVRITKKGDDKVSDGEGGNFKWQDEPELPRSVAQGLEEKGFGEILE